MKLGLWAKLMKACEGLIIIESHFMAFWPFTPKCHYVFMSLTVKAVVTNGVSQEHMM